MKIRAKENASYCSTIKENPHSCCIPQPKLKEECLTVVVKQKEYWKRY